MDISLLPEELFEEIALYLDLPEVLSCCLVNSRWRNAMNKNRIWFNLCAKRFSVNMQNLDMIKSPCLVDPPFTPPRQKCFSLSETCPWRLRFMQEAHVMRNWRFGRYMPHVITKTINPLCLECDEDVIVISSMEKREFTTWTIESFPVEVQTTPFSLWHVISDFFKLSGDKLVVVQCTLLQVFVKNKSNRNMFDLTYRFLFNKSEEESLNIPSTAVISDWYNNNIGLYPSDLNTVCDHNGDYFVGLIQEGNMNKTIFHIWDINSGHKAGEQLIPQVDELVTDVHFSLHSSNLHILMKLRDNIKERTTIFCFSLDTFKYTNLRIMFDYVVPIVLFGEQFLLNTDVSGRNIWLWKNEDGGFLHKLCCNFDIQPTSLQFVLSFVIFAGNSDCTGNVMVFDTKTLKTTCEFVTDYRVTNLLFIRSELILVGGWMQLGIWELSTATKLHTLNFQDCLWVNQYKTKTIVENDDDLLLLHFW